MDQTLTDWRACLEPTDPVASLIAGQGTERTPAMPICQDVPALPFQHQRILEVWAERIDQSEDAGRLPALRFFREHNLSRAEIVIIVHLLFKELCLRLKQAGVTSVRTMIAREQKLVLSFFRSQGLRTGPYIELEKQLT